MTNQADSGSGGTGARLAPANSSPPIKILGDFELRREVGRGGMGTVYEAWQRSLQRVVALKVLAPHVSSTPRAVVRFQREAQAAAKLHHTHIVPIFAQGEADGTYFYAMEFVQGRSLHSIISELRNSEIDSATTMRLGETVALPRSDSGVGGSRSGTGQFSGSGIANLDGEDDKHHRAASAPSSKSRSIALDFHSIAQHMANVADALAYAHQEGVIHRDIKPHNLILGDDGRMRVSDFGLARLSEQPGVTVTGEMLGSPLYMSPEQIRGNPDEVDHRADIYSLGATMYEWLTLRPPYPGETRERVISLILSTEPKPVRHSNAAVPLDLETICMKAVERDRDRRYRSAGELRDDLRRYIASRPIEAKRAGLVRTGTKFVLRHQIASLLVVAAVVALLLSWQVHSKQQKFETASAKVIEATQQAEQTAVQNKLLLEAMEAIGGALQGGPATVVDAAVPLFQGLAHTNPTKILGGGATTLDGQSDAFGRPLGIARRTAIELFEQVTPRNWPPPHQEGEDPALHHLRTAMKQWSNSEVKSALTSLEAYLAIHPADFEVLQLHGILSAQIGDYSAFAEDASKLVATGDRRATALTWMGLSHLLQEQVALSVADFTGAIEADRKLPWPWVLRGLALLQLGRNSEALTEFDSALMLSPKLVPALLGRANARSSMRYYEAAVQDATEVLSSDPNVTDALVIRADSYVQLEQYSAAARDLEQAIKLSGSSMTLLTQYAAVSVREKRAQEKGKSDKKGTQSEMNPPGADPDDHRTRGPFFDNFFRKLPPGGSSPGTPGVNLRFPTVP